ncbi:alanine--tRNA ligase [bacterium endosymbiont of Pedicinus badii]|uniref:alanine--tRNA ligase n=1 Tax=bacterium endosymbiont of Pedicinus badii TaxID=1719126 RepID=UPI0009B97862|nr:alanine--tRNA ligase [bacterium endosymbiont of Pedicinus badii]OQM34245.1 hypothetical protein AOQ89_02845 [bacterium endosymbiont of Pedicinus badii]
MKKKNFSIKKKFLEFFQYEKHFLMNGSPIFAKNDPSLLFTNAGMNQFKDFFLGKKKSNYKNIATVQNCIRIGGKHNDLEQVGYTSFHHTFFEMLGNFSFGGYFKEQAIEYAWKFLTHKDWLSIEKNRFFITVYYKDFESYKIWRKKIKIPKERILKIGPSSGKSHQLDNFWQMEEFGLCGPCSEIFYEFGEDKKEKKNFFQDCKNNKYVEVWNLVFIQFNKDSSGSLINLKQNSVDTGMGLERMSAVLENVNSSYKTRLFLFLIESASKSINCFNKECSSLKIIADHIRSCIFLIHYGIYPGNEGRNYIVRRLIRRAVIHGTILGAKKPFFYRMVDYFSKIYKKKEEINFIKFNKKKITEVIRLEEEQFFCNLQFGINILKNKIENSKKGFLDGKEVFTLYDTYGIPIEITKDFCQEKHIAIDYKGFKKEMELQKNRSRQDFFDKRKVQRLFLEDCKTDFIGYKNYKCNSQVLKIFSTNNNEVDKIAEGEEGILVLNKTTFFGSSGGQVGDSGTISKKNSLFEVENTEISGSSILHYGKLILGNIFHKDKVICRIDTEKRKKSSINHTSTHILHTILKKNLDEKISQKGSYINENYLSFDFSYSKSIDFIQLQKIEKEFNKIIWKNFSVEENFSKNKNINTVEDLENKKSRKISIGKFSNEFCCGTHIKNTREIGFFHILYCKNIGKEVKRIKAVTYKKSIKIVQKKMLVLQSIQNLFFTDYKKVFNKISFLEKKNISYKELILKIKKKLKEREKIFLQKKIYYIRKISIIVAQISSLDTKFLKDITIDLLKSQKKIIAVLYFTKKNRLFFSSIVKGVQNKDINSTKILKFLKKLTYGKGGGNKNISFGSGFFKDSDNLQEKIVHFINYNVNK